MSLKSFQLNLSNVRPWLFTLGLIWLLGSVGLGWLVNSFLILFTILSLAPVVAFLGFRWWLSRNLVTDNCPVCRYESSGLNNSQLQCPNCGEQLMVQNGHFKRFTPEGTIDVKAVEVSARAIEE